jgi:hypothetical protein
LGPNKLVLNRQSAMELLRYDGADRYPAFLVAFWRRFGFAPDADAASLLSWWCACVIATVDADIQEHALGTVSPRYAWFRLICALSLLCARARGHGRSGEGPELISAAWLQHQIR